MRSALRIAAYTFAAGLALLVSACGTTGHDPQFQKPAVLPPKITLTPEMVAGHEFSSTDQKGIIWIRPTADGKLTAGGNGKTYVKDGRWHIRDGNLCLSSPTWWGKGNCYEVFGQSIEQAERWHPLEGKWNFMYMPFRMNS